MNFLAHILLSDDDDKIMVGNFIGDFIKGSQLGSFDDKIQQGVRLHRSIDQFTDTHSVVLESKKRLRPVFGHYSPVIIDVFYDHFLARQWSAFSNEPLMDYSQQVYKKIQAYVEQIPKVAANVLLHMSKGNWLYHYQFIEGIDQALTGMSKRTNFNSKMEIAASFLQKNYFDYQKEFNEFFPELKKHVANFEL